ncbi:MAG: tetraacyldisaccharide 4'-kinase [Pirellulaceae bacterium]|nr:MAG: tetraacyldisaccharide 4'-kinase [Pirellulaceae bacterium]
MRIAKWYLVMEYWPVAGKAVRRFLDEVCERMRWRDLVCETKPSAAVVAARLAMRGLALPYSVGVRVRNLLYQRGWKSVHRAEVPVVSVGNLSVGGTGKTPMVSFLCRQLRAEGVRAAVLSRGYGQLDDGLNDEALELELLHPDVPHLQHPDRVASARIAVEQLEMEALVLDDGFQHRRLHRDLDIVLIDATDPDAAWRTFPAGVLREPLSALRRCHVVVLTRTDQVCEPRLQALERRLQRFVDAEQICRSVHRARRLVGYPDHEVAFPTNAGEPVLAFCGIGNPQAFFRQLEMLGFDLLDRRIFPDHHAYQADDVLALQRWVDAVPAAQRVLCTMKDLVKLQAESLGGKPLQALGIEMELIPPSAYWHEVWGRFRTLIRLQKTTTCTSDF